MKTIRLLSLAAAIGTLLTAMQGRLVRATGASQSCPDWPLCRGQLIPPMDLLVFLEWFHRFLVLATTLIVVAIVVVAWRRSGLVRRYGLLCLSLLLATAAIGGLSILMPVHPLLLAADQGLAMATFGSLVALTVWGYLAERSAALV